jgi:hypothetical protein
VTFLGSKFSGRTDFNDSIFDKSVYFNYVDFKSSSEVSFRTSDLQHVSFLNSDITGIIFDENAPFGTSGLIPIKYTTVDESKFEKQITTNASLPSNKEDSFLEDLIDQDEVLYEVPTLGALFGSL